MRPDRLPGDRRAMSLHPSGCVRLCLRRRIAIRRAASKCGQTRYSAPGLESIKRCPRGSKTRSDPMPNLPKPRLRRSARTSADGHATQSPAEPNAEVVEHDGLRWVNIERPGSLDQAWLEEHFEFHALDYEDIRSRNQRPKIDEYDDYLFIVLHFPVFDKQVGRLNAAELDIFVGPDYLITLPNSALPPVEYLFERCRTSEAMREQLLSKGSGYLL